jgi:hypothetical protein
VTITGTNDPPVVTNAIPDLTATMSQPFSYTVAANVFSDVDSSLTLTASRSDGSALPIWLTFNSATRTFSGTPQGSDSGPLAIRLTASDGLAQASDEFTLTVNAINLTITGTAASETLSGDIGNDTIIGKAGNDVLFGLLGNDTIYGDGLGEVGPPPGPIFTPTPTAQSYLAAGPNLINALGGSAGFGEEALVRQDDAPSSNVVITGVFGPTGLNFFGHNYTSVFVNNNGNITFAGPSSTFTPGVITAGTGNPIIAPFWADVDTRVSGPLAPTPGGNSTGSNLVYWDLDQVNGVLTVTWDDVGYFGNHVDKLNAFQLQLINQGNGDFDIIFRYEAVNWTTGDASGGVGGLGGTPARAGYNAGNGLHSFELPQSGNQAQMLGIDPGVYMFQVRNGIVITDMNDRIDGGPGHDTLTGGPGNDTFVFRRGEAHGDTIIDFSGNGANRGDQLEFVGFGAGAAFEQVSSTEWHIIAGGTRETITLANAAPISPSDYLFT